MNNSNIKVRSNIYPRNGRLAGDSEFVKRVRGRKALEKLLYLTSLKPERDLTDAQRSQLENDIKCFYNKKEDFTWGLAVRNGTEQWVCRCENHSCRFFDRCRPGITEEEINQLKQRRFEKQNAVFVTETEIHRGFSARHSKLFMEECDEKADKDSTGSDIPDYGTVTGYKDIGQSSIAEKKQDSKKAPFHDIEVIDVSGIVHGTADSEVLNTGEDHAQMEVIRAPYESRIFVNAGPGTGKTYTLIERIKYLTRGENAIDTEEMIVLGFSRSAIAEINRRLKEQDKTQQETGRLNMLEIRTFDSFATELLIRINPGTDLSGKGYDERIEMAIDAIAGNPDIFKFTKHLIVDEIQDLVGVRARFVQTILEHANCGFTLLGDLCQSIYDYQVKNENHDITSEEFHQWLQDKYRDSLMRFEFRKNHRQEKKLFRITETVRESILNGDKKEQETVIIDTLRSFRLLGEVHTLRNSIKDGRMESTCFLCRTNGQALKVSKYLRDQGIEHRLQRSATFKLLDRWIGEVLGEYRERSVKFEKFKEIMETRYPLNSNEIKTRWELLKQVEGGRSSGIRIEDLAVNLGHRKNLYECLCTGHRENIVVSTIHRAKGREYDTVIVLDDSVLAYKERNGVTDEVKIYYVAITRPRQNVFRTSFRKVIYMKKVGDGDQRWVETGLKWKRNRKKPVVKYVEVGKEKDVDPVSFVEDDILEENRKPFENQKYIRTRVNRGDLVVLRMLNDGNNILYGIYHNRRRIGKMSLEFTYALFSVFRDVYGTRTMDRKYFPREIREVFVEEICTYTKVHDNLIIPEIYRNNGLWTGIAVAGLGKLEWNAYY